MKKFADRCREIREQGQQSLQSRMIFLLGKDTRVLEAIVAWTSLDIKLPDIMVEDDASIQDLWRACEPDMVAFSTALGCPMTEALPRFSQLVQLGIVYPDGTAADLAMSIVNTYITVQVGDLRKRRDKVQG